MGKSNYKDHPLSSLLPMMGQIEIRELAADIQLNGLRAPITLFEDMILDGRNRYRACEIAGVQPRFREYNGEGDALDFIVSVNVKRRHLTASQKGLVAAKYATMERGRPTKNKSATLPIKRSEADVSEELGVSSRTVRTAKTVLKEAPKEEIAAIERGEKTVTEVARETKAKAAAKEQHFDKTGYPIPEGIWEDWQRAEGFGEALKEISRIKLLVSTGLEEGDVIYRELNQGAVSMLKNVYGELKCVIPYAVCSTCQGKLPQSCALCKGRGFLSDFAWHQFVSAEAREMRAKVGTKR